MTCRKTPVGGPPLWYWPVECRNRGPQPKVAGRPVRRASGGADARRARRARSGRGRPSPRGSRVRGRAGPSSAATAPARSSTPSSRPGGAADLDRRRRRGPAAPASGVPSSRPRAAFLALSTSGWSNGLMPSSRPATAVAYSQSSICAPSEPPTLTVVASGAAGRRASPSPARSPGRRRRRRAARAGRRTPASAPRGRAGPRRRPAAARCRPCRWTRRSSCSAQSAKPTIRGPSAASTSLSGAGGSCGRPASAAPSTSAGLPSASSASRSATAAASSSSAATSTPASPLGTRPNAVSARVAAADVRVGEDDAVAGRRGRSARSGEPGSVTTTIRPAGSMPASREGAARTPGAGCRSRPCRRTCSTRRPRCARAGRPAAARTWSGSVVSRTVSGDAGGRADHLGRQRRAAHAGEHDVVDALGRSSARSAGELGDQRPRGLGQADPGQPDRGLGLGVRAPQGGVLRDQPGGDPVVDQAGHVRADRVRGRAGGRDLDVPTPRSPWPRPARAAGGPVRVRQPRSAAHSAGRLGASSSLTVRGSSSQLFSNFSTPSPSSTRGDVVVGDAERAPARRAPRGPRRSRRGRCRRGSRRGRRRRPGSRSASC